MKLAGVIQSAEFRSLRPRSGCAAKSAWRTPPGLNTGERRCNSDIESPANGHLLRGYGDVTA
jgi:hypothetical protein